MKKVICRILPVLAIALVIAMVSGIAVAQDPGQPFKTNYFSNNVAAAPDGVLRITNDGALGGVQPNGDLCAMIYVYAADQQQVECCGCLVTPNGLQTADIKTNLTANPLTGVKPTDGVIQVITAIPNSTGSPTAIYPDNSPLCDPTANPFLPPFATTPVFLTGPSATVLPVIPFPDLREWTTHIQAVYTKVSSTGAPVSPTYTTTETENSPAFLNPSEYGVLTAECYFSAILLGSGQGVCDCGKFEQ